MCGVVGYTGKKQAVDWLLDGLATLESVKQRREARHALDFLTPDEVRAVADACDAGTFQGRRDSMMVMLMFNTGFRLTEVVELRA